MRLRVNPATGRLAERIPADAAYTDGTAADGARWFTYRFDAGAGLTVELLTDEQVAEWPEVSLAPKPPDPEFAFVLACPTCDAHRLLTNPHERELLAARHDAEHDTRRFAVKIQHPDVQDMQQFAAGDEVTFHGSAEGEAAELVDATVWEAATQADSDGEQVPGYVVGVGEHGMWVPATALHAA